MSENRRVEQTKKSIRDAFLRAAIDMRPKDMKIVDLADDAGISRKTVYRHYRNMDEIADDVCDHETDGIITHLTGDLTGDIELIYEFFDGTDSGTRELLFGGVLPVPEEILP